MKTTTIWKTGQAFESFQNHSKIEIDAKAGFSPKALLLSGLAGCTGIDVVEILEKMRVPFADLQIDAEAEQTDERIELRPVKKTGRKSKRPLIFLLKNIAGLLLC